MVLALPHARGPLAVLLAMAAMAIPTSASARDAATGQPAALAAAACTKTLSPGADIASNIESAANGDVICLNGGDYGDLTIGAERDGYVTVRSVTPHSARFDEIALDNAAFIRLEHLHVEDTISSGLDNTSNIQLVANDVTGIVIEAPPSNSSGPGPSNWTIEYNHIHDCDGHCVALVSDDPDDYWPVSDITVRGNRIGPMAGGEDAIRLHNFRDVLIEDNEIFGVIENGGHNDCLQSVWGGDGLTFRRNYLHDNNCQTFFLKDGHTSNIVFSDNLSVRNRDGDAEVVGQIWNSSDVSITNNTIWDESALYVRYGSVADIFPDGPVEDYTAFNNVIEDFVPYDDFETDDNRAGIFTDPDVLDEDFNLFGGGWTWVPEHMGTHSIQDSTPAFINATDSAGEDLASGDFRLASPITKSGVTYDAGITWLLAGRRFGPDAYVAPTCQGAAATIIGTSSADTLVGTSGADVIVGREGNDTISGLGGGDLICGDAGKDVVLGGAGMDGLYGEAGADTLRGGVGPDTVVGGIGNDSAYGDSGADALGGGDGADELRGGNGADTVEGDAGADDLYGGNADDVLFGLAGMDDMFGGAGNDDCNGGPGTDSADAACESRSSVP
jgi:Ca2+-binding RTX toxin-like protein